MDKLSLCRKTLSPLGKDVMLCVLLVVISALMTFFNLGDSSFPQTSYSFADNEPVFIDFGKTINFQGAVFLNGGSPYAGFRLYSWDGENVINPLQEETRNIHFRWLAFTFETRTRYVVIEPTAPNISILEMGFLSNNKFIEPVSFSTSEAVTMFDEQSLIPENPSYMNDMNFDETHHALTAYDFIHNQQPREWTHPPFGKSIIATGIRMFGMTPFGWRFMCALFGIIMIIPLYLLGKFMFGSRIPAFAAAFVFAFDFMHFVQARVATLDTFLVTFIIFMYLFMYKYIKIEPEKRLEPKSLVCLALSGAFMGLAISVKWQGVYAGLGLAALFALTWYDSKTHYDTHKRKESLIKDFSKTAKWCALFFVAIPLAIYCVSYIPFVRASGLRWPKGIIDSQLDMLNFHTNLAEDNDYQSRWWTWPLNLRPIYYYRLNKGDGVYRGINSFGNPALWWGGLLALLWCIKRWIADHDKTARFLVVTWTSQIMPWVFVDRSTFIYHYFPCVPFLALMTAHFINTRPEKHKMKYALAYCVLVFALFIMFYPTLSGMIVDVDYIAGLEWLPGWQFQG